MNLLRKYEEAVGLGPVDGSRLLGVAYSTYAQYRRGHRELPHYIALHAELIMRLPAPLLAAIIKERVIAARAAKQDNGDL